MDLIFIIVKTVGKGLKPVSNNKQTTEGEGLKPISKGKGCKKIYGKGSKNFTIKFNIC